MPGISGRKLVCLYVVLAVMAALGYARYSPYTMDGDGVSYLDIAQSISEGHFADAVNGYWNPGYPAILAVGRVVMHPSNLTEPAMARCVNVVIFMGAILASLLLTTGLVRLREKHGKGENTFGVPAYALHLIGLAMLVMSAGRELSIGVVRTDTLLMTLLLTTAGLAIWLQAGARFWMYPLLGVAMGWAALTKSFALVSSCLLLIALLVIGLRRKASERKRMVGGVLVAGLVLAAMLGPYLVAVDRQLGRFTIGDSGKWNYCNGIDGMPVWHEWYDQKLGHATGPFKHPEKVLVDSPAVFSFAAHPKGTFPLWYDPAYWTDGMTPHFWLKGQIDNLLWQTKNLSRFVLGRTETLLLLAVMAAFGARLPRRANWKVWSLPVLWGLVMVGIYLPILIQDRYLSAPLMLIVLPLFAWLQVCSGDETHVPTLASALVLLMAGIALFQAEATIAEERRMQRLVQDPGFGSSPQITVAARGLVALGLKPGEKVACFGDVACYVDPYWARQAQTQVLAEVRTKDSADPETVWNAIPDKQAVTRPLKDMGLRFIVGKFENSAAKPVGWVQLGSSDYFAYALSDSAQPKAATLAGGRF